MKMTKYFLSIQYSGTYVASDLDSEIFHQIFAYKSNFSGLNKGIFHPVIPYLLQFFQYKCGILIWIKEFSIGCQLFKLISLSLQLLKTKK